MSAGLRGAVDDSQHVSSRCTRTGPCLRGHVHAKCEEVVVLAWGVQGVCMIICRACVDPGVPALAACFFLRVQQPRVLQDVRALRPARGVWAQLPVLVCCSRHRCACLQFTCLKVTLGASLCVQHWLQQQQACLGAGADVGGEEFSPRCAGLVEADDFRVTTP